jgi:hypothetical protein
VKKEKQKSGGYKMTRNKSQRLKMNIKANADKYSMVPEFVLVRAFKNNKRRYYTLLGRIQRSRIHNWRRNKRHLSKNI